MKESAFIRAVSTANVILIKFAYASNISKFKFTGDIKIKIKFGNYKRL